MFTGIIEEQGTIERLTARGSGFDLWVRAAVVLSDAKLGDSIAHDGVCLTIAELAPPRYRCDVTAETVRATTLGQRRSGDRVNLERALAVGARLGGHFVQGHVDGVGAVAAATPRDAAGLLRFTAPPELAPYLARKGSVAVDGISLTIVEADAAGFTVSPIPHTLEVTTLGQRRPGEAVNIEVDVLARYVLAALQTDPGPAGNGPRLTWAWLAEQGYG